MADNLRVDTDGLRSAATSSDGLASVPATRGSGGAAASQPSHGGVTAILVAAQAVRGRHSARVMNQANDMRRGASRYDATDGHNASDIAKAT